MKRLFLTIMALGLILASGGVALAGAADQQTIIVGVQIGGLVPDPNGEAYWVSLGVSNAEFVSRLIITVEEEESGTLVIEKFLSLNGRPTVRVDLETANLKPGRKYVLKVQAENVRGILFERPSDSGFDQENKTVLASKTFATEEVKETPLEAKIETVTPNWEADRLIIILDLPDNADVFKYDGFIATDAGVVPGGEFEGLYKGKRVEVSIPRAMREAKEALDYRVTVRLYTKDNRRTDATLEKFKPGLAPRPTFGQRVSNALGKTPWIALAIVIVISGAATWYILASRRRGGPELPLQRPPIDNSMIIRATPARGRLRLRVVQSPGAARGTEKTLARFPCVIGRQEDCDIPIPDDHQISRRHAEITMQGGQAFVTDLGSTNGTFIGERRLKANVPTSLAGIATVRFGTQTVIEVDFGGSD